VNNDDKPLTVGQFRKALGAMRPGHRHHLVSQDRVDRALATLPPEHPVCREWVCEFSSRGKACSACECNGHSSDRCATPGCGLRYAEHPKPEQYQTRAVVAQQRKTQAAVSAALHGECGEAAAGAALGEVPERAKVVAWIAPQNISLLTYSTEQRSVLAYRHGVPRDVPVVLASEHQRLLDAAEKRVAELERLHANQRASILFYIEERDKASSDLAAANAKLERVAKAVQA